MKSSLQWTVCEPLQMFYIWLSSQLVWKSFKKEQFGFFLRWLASSKVRLRRKILGFLIWDKVSIIGNYQAKKKLQDSTKPHFKNNNLNKPIWLLLLWFWHLKPFQIGFPATILPRNSTIWICYTAAKRIFSTSTRPLCSLKTVHILANRQFCKQRTHSFLR